LNASNLVARLKTSNSRGESIAQRAIYYGYSVHHIYTLYRQHITVLFYCLVAPSFCFIYTIMTTKFRLDKIPE